MIGDRSEIFQHLTSARQHADQAESEARPELYREAVDELSVAIELLMRNTEGLGGDDHASGDSSTVDRR